MGHPALRTPGSGRPAGKERTARCREPLWGAILYRPGLRRGERMRAG